MSEKNRRHHVRVELARAEKSLGAAETLLSLGLPAESVQRSWYSSFYTARALLFSRGIDPPSDEAAIRLLKAEILGPGLLDLPHERVTAGMERARELADYKTAVTFSAEDAQAELDAVRLFTRDAVALLTREGWTGR